MLQPATSPLPNRIGRYTQSFQACVKLLLHYSSAPYPLLSTENLTTLPLSQNSRLLPFSISRISVVSPPFNLLRQIRRPNPALCSTNSLFRKYSTRLFSSFLTAVSHPLRTSLRSIRTACFSLALSISLTRVSSLLIDKSPLTPPTHLSTVLPRPHPTPNLPYSSDRTTCCLSLISLPVLNAFPVSAFSFSCVPFPLGFNFSALWLPTPQAKQ